MKAAVLLAIRELNLSLQVIFNKESVMILPRGTNKSTGLSAVLSDLGLSSQSVVGIGDAENDHELLSFCGCSVAVANAIPALKQRADVVTGGSYGAGVLEVIHRLIDTDQPLLIAHPAARPNCDSNRFAGSSSRTSHSSAIKVLAQR